MRARSVITLGVDFTEVTYRVLLVQLPVSFCVCLLLFTFYLYGDLQLCVNLTDDLLEAS